MDLQLGWPTAPTQPLPLILIEIVSALGEQPIECKFGASSQFQLDSLHGLGLAGLVS